MPRRVMITSVGAISSLGSSPDEMLHGLKTDKTAFEQASGDASGDASVVVCPIRNFKLRDFTGPFKERRYLNRGAGFSVAAAMAAINNAGIDRSLLKKAGLFVGAGPHLDIGGEFPEIRAGMMDREDLMALWMLRFLPNTAAAVIAGLASIHGENLTVGAACAASLQAIGEAYRKIRDGYLDIALAGGGDSRLHHGGILAYKKARALSLKAGDPKQASRPFDRERDGFIPGEGGAFFVLEEIEHAKRRGASLYGEICGFGNSINGAALTAPDPEGKQEEVAVRNAIAEAGLDPSRIDLVSAHGTSTLLNDDMEATMLHRVFGKDGPYVIALKSWTGHLAAACGAVELAVSLACLNNDYLPSIRNLQTPCREGIRFVRGGVTASPQIVLLENFGFGGQNAALVVKKVN